MKCQIKRETTGFFKHNLAFKSLREEQAEKKADSKYLHLQCFHVLVDPLGFQQVKSVIHKQQGPSIHLLICLFQDEKLQLSLTTETILRAK